MIRRASISAVNSVNKIVATSANNIIFGGLILRRSFGNPIRISFPPAWISAQNQVVSSLVILMEIASPVRAARALSNKLKYGRNSFLGGSEIMSSNSMN